MLIWPMYKAPGDSFSTLPYFQLPRDLLPERSGAQKSDLHFGTLSAEEESTISVNLKTEYTSYHRQASIQPKTIATIAKPVSNLRL